MIRAGNLHLLIGRQCLGEFVFQSFDLFEQPILTQRIQLWGCAPLQHVLFALYLLLQRFNIPVYAACTGLVEHHSGGLNRALKFLALIEVQVRLFRKGID